MKMFKKGSQWILYPQNSYINIGFDISLYKRKYIPLESVYYCHDLLKSEIFVGLCNTIYTNSLIDSD